MGRPHYVVKPGIKDEFSHLCQHCWDNDEISSHCRLHVIFYKGRTTSTTLIVMVMAHEELQHVDETKSALHQAESD